MSAQATQQSPPVSILVPQAPDPRESWARPFIWRDPASLPRRRFIYGGHFIRQFVSVTIAPSGAGKSGLLVAEGLAMASGKDLLGVQPQERLRVWIWSGEDPQEETDRRIAAAAIHYGLGRDDLEGWLHVGSGRETDLIIAEQTREGAEINAPVIGAVIEMIRRLRIDVVIIDPFISSHRVTENDNPAIDRVAKQWAKIAEATNAAVELVHHSRKTGGQEITVEDGRGASALIAASRSARVINPMTKEEGERAGVPNHKWFFRTDTGKANLRSPAASSDWYGFVSVNLGNGELPGTGDDVGVVTPWEWPNAMSGVSGNHLIRTQDIVAAGQYRDNSQAADWVGKVIAQVVGLDLDLKADKAKAAAIYREWKDKGLFSVEHRRDAKGNERPCVIVSRWAER